MGCLRLFLAISVVMVHLGTISRYSPLGGVEAVQTFFIISGFYMGMILNEKYRGPGSYRLFLTNRFLRIYPVYWVVAGLAALVYVALYLRTGLGPMNLFRQTGLTTSLLITVSNIALFGQDAVMFFTNNHQGQLVFTNDFWASNPRLCDFTIIPPAWSLSIELMFYVLAPVIARKSWKTLVVLLLSSLLIRLFFHFGLHLRNDPWSYRFFPIELAFFFAGLLSYRTYRWMRSADLLASLCRWSIPIFVGFCFAYQFLPGWQIQGFLVKEWSFYPLAAATIPALFAMSKRSAIDRYLGELSYPVYVIHPPAVQILSLVLARLGMARFFPIWVIVSTFLASVLVIHLVVNPLEAYRQARVRTQCKTKQGEVPPIPVGVPGPADSHEMPPIQAARPI